MPEPGASGGALCVFCRRQPVDPAWRPFCSERCRLQDLARWVDGAYKVPGEPINRSERQQGDADANEPDPDR